MKTEKAGIIVSVLAISVIAGFASFFIAGNVNKNASLSVSKISSYTGAVSGYNNNNNNNNNNVLGANTEDQKGVAGAIKDYYLSNQADDNYLTDTPTSNN